MKRGQVLVVRFIPHPSRVSWRKRTMTIAQLAPSYSTALGVCCHGDAIDMLRGLATDSVALVMTSPPFALRRKKAYGNVAAAEYVDWFTPFAEEIYRVLRPDGSFVFDLG